MRKTVLFCIMLLSFTVSNLTAQYRILLLGDSITKGLYSSSNNGFRSYLYQSLEHLNFPFEFVGSVGDDPYYCFCKEGANIDMFLPAPTGTGQLNVTQDMYLYQPNIVMIHIGTNDIDWGLLTPYSSDGGETLLDNTVTGMLANLLAYLVQWKTGTRSSCLDKIFVCQIIDKTGKEARVLEYNAGINTIYNDSEAGNIPSIPPGTLKIVDQYSDFNPSTMFYSDGVHPNDLGYQNIASNYYDAIRTLPMHLSIVTNDTLKGIANYNLFDPLQVKVVDDFGTGVNNFEVEFSIVEGNAALVGDTKVVSNIDGIAEIDIYVDEVGTSIVRVKGEQLITDSLDFVVECIEGIHVAGEVKYQQSHAPIPGVEFLYVENQAISTSSDENGNYLLPSLLPGVNVTLQITKPQWSDVGPWMILSYDAAIIAQYVVGRRPLSGDAYNAADVNQDSIVTILDAALIARRAAGMPLSQENKSGSWVFKPDSVYISPLLENVEGQNVDGYVLGDVHTLWNLDGDISKSGQDFFITPLTMIQEDSTLILPVQIKGNNICSFDYLLSTDETGLNFESIQMSSTTPNFNIQSTHYDDGTIRVGGYANESLGNQSITMNICFKKAISSRKVSVDLNPIYLNDQLMEPVYVEHETDTDQFTKSFILMPNYPNPFNNSTVIQFYIHESKHVEISIYNTLGQEVIQLADKEFDAGHQQVVWDGNDKLGQTVSSGIYLYRVKAGTQQYVRKMEIIQ